MAMATEMRHAEADDRGSCQDPLTSRVISEHRGLERLFQQYEQLPPGTNPMVGCMEQQQCNESCCCTPDVAGLNVLVPCGSAKQGQFAVTVGG
jgi:hypothetical protein